jgi:hypothetical protein
LRASYYAQCHKDHTMQAGSGRFSMHFDGVHLDLYATDYVWDCFTGHGWRRTGSAMVLDLPGMSRSGSFIFARLQCRGCAYSRGLTRFRRMSLCLRYLEPRTACGCYARARASDYRHPLRTTTNMVYGRCMFCMFTISTI